MSGGVLKVEGKWHPELAKAVIETQGPAAVRACAQYLLDESRKQVPHDTGTLEGTGTVDSQELQATVSYDTPYACRWHEQDANFQGGRKKKYLEDPCNDSGVQAKMLDYLKNNLKF